MLRLSLIVTLMLAAWSMRPALAALPSPDAGATAVSTRPDGWSTGERASREESFPVLAEPRQHWAAAVVISIIGLFVAAAVIGPVVRANAPQDLPIAHAHDEPPGSSHRHGSSGTVQPDPPHDLRRG